MTMLAQTLIAESPYSRVAIVDDDDLFRESLGLNLAEEGYDVIDFANGESALEFLRSGESVEAVLLDWRMPGLDGLAVLRHMREYKIHTPVIFLTVLTDEIYEEAALKWGAVDFIDKSRRLPIILQRLKIITEGGKPSGAGEVPDTVSDRFLLGDLDLRTDINRAFWQGQEIDLTLTEFTIVHFLATRDGGDVTYRQIYDIVRGKDFVAGYGPDGYRANVRSFIKRIRKKFRDVDGHFEGIENYPGYGYRWRKAGADHGV